MILCYLHVKSRTYIFQVTGYHTLISSRVISATIIADMTKTASYSFHTKAVTGMTFHVGAKASTRTMEKYIRHFVSSVSTNVKQVIQYGF